MRLVLRGPFPVEQAKSTVADFLDGLVEGGVDVVSGVSLYFSAYSEGRTVTIHNDAGVPVDEIEVRNPTKSVISSNLIGRLNKPGDAGRRLDDEEAQLGRALDRKWTQASPHRQPSRSRKKRTDGD